MGSTNWFKMSNVSLRIILEALKYYFLTSYHRKMLDQSLSNYSHYFKGRVLDVGGGKKDGRFNPQKTDKWVVVDIDKSSNPDIVGSVEKLPLKSQSFDVVKATELFEHVDDFEKGLKECSRVLKKNGYLIISCPFMSPIHLDPSDYQRLTLQKWKNLAKKNNLQLVVIKEQGYFFTLIGEMVRTFVTNIPSFVIRYPLYLTFPLLDLIKRLDGLPMVKKTKHLNGFVGGYFFVLQKS